MESIKVICRKCGKLVKAEELILDPIYKLMVCPLCVKARESKESLVEFKIIKEPEVKKIITPKDFIEEPTRITNKLNIIKEQDGLCRCLRCSYKFKYNFDKGIPALCPYCGCNIQNY